MSQEELLRRTLKQSGVYSSEAIEDMVSRMHVSSSYSAVRRNNYCKEIVPGPLDPYHRYYNLATALLAISISYSCHVVA